MKKIHVLDRFQAAKFVPPENCGLVRIFSSDRLENLTYPPINFDNYASVCQYTFDDITPADLRAMTKDGEDISGFVLFSEVLARKIIADFRTAMLDLTVLVVHCKNGKNRSPSLAAGLNHVFNLRIPDEAYIDAGYHEPNMHVYETLVATARRDGMRFKAKWLGE